MEESKQFLMLIDDLVLPISIFLINYLLYPRFERFLRRRGIVQIIRKEGPDIHGYKEGTPIMGGLLFIGVVLIFSSIRYGDLEISIICISTFLFMSVGLLDDLLRSFRKNWEGLKPYQKILLQLIVSILVLVMIQRSFPHTYTLVPFLNDKLELGPFFYNILAIFVLLGTVNAVNLTDGVDGLAGSVFISTAIPYFLLLWKLGWNCSKILYLSVFGVLPFLWYNFKPARIFMGDTGSMGLGGLIGTIAVLSGTELFLPFVAFIYLIETISVILQVGYYKMTGNRIFKMAPLHHHFELIGWNEEKIVFRFSMLNLLFALLVLRDVISR